MDQNRIQLEIEKKLIPPFPFIPKSLVVPEGGHHIGRDALEYISLSIDGVINANLIESQSQDLSCHVSKTLGRLPIEVIPTTLPGIRIKH